MFQKDWFHHQLDNLRIKLDRGAHLIAMLAYFLLRGGGANHKVAVLFARFRVSILENSARKDVTERKEVIWDQ